MLRRMEVYADAALLAFPIAIVLLFAYLAVIESGSEVLIPMALVGGVVAIGISRLLHHKSTAEPLEREEAMRIGWVALAVLLVAGAMAGVLALSAGSRVVLMWVGVAIVAIAGVALLGDAIADLAKERTHKVLDILRVGLVGVLGFALIGSGTDAQTGIWVVGVLVYLLGVALVAYGYDLVASWWTHRREAHSGLIPSQ